MATHAFHTRNVAWLMVTLYLSSFFVLNGSAECMSELTSAVSSGTPQEGSVIVLSCNVSPDNRQNTSWYKDDTLLTTGYINYVKDEHYIAFDNTVTNGCQNYGLAINAVSQRTSGSYTCRIGNATSSEIVVNVVYTPDQLLYPMCGIDLGEDGLVDDGSYVRLVCETERGYPNWFLTWSPVPAGSNLNVSSSAEYTTTVLEVPVTQDIFGQVFSCSSACDTSQMTNCTTSETRECSVHGALFSVTPTERRIDVGGNVNFTCQTSLRAYRVLWLIPDGIDQLLSIETDCSPNSTMCNLRISGVTADVDGTGIACWLYSISLDKMIKSTTVTLLVGPLPSSTIAMSASTGVATSSPVTAIALTSRTISTVSRTLPLTTQERPTSRLIPPPPPPSTPPPPPPKTPTIMMTTGVPNIPTTMATTRTVTEPQATISKQTLFNVFTEITSRTSKQITEYTPHSVSEADTDAIRITGTITGKPATLASSAGKGVGVQEIIAIVVTVAVLLIILVVLVACLLLRGKRRAEKQGRLRRNVAMLESQGQSPFNAYDMQAVLAEKQHEEMSGPNGEVFADNSEEYLAPLHDDRDEGGVETGLDNRGFDKDSALYASIPSKTGSPRESINQNGSIDHGYFEHYPDSEQGGTRIVQGVISTTL